MVAGVPYPLFGWKDSAFIYHNIGSAVSSFFRAEGIPCSIYVDDRLMGELMCSSAPWSVPAEMHCQTLGEKGVQSAIYLVCLMLIGPGYVLGLSKCGLIPMVLLEVWGFTVSYELRAFKISLEKLCKFSKLRDSILWLKKRVPVKMLQHFQGMCFVLSHPS